MEAVDRIPRLVVGAVSLNVLAIRGGAYVDGWPMFTIVGALGGGLLLCIILGPTEAESDAPQAQLAERTNGTKGG